MKRREFMGYAVGAIGALALPLTAISEPEPPHYGILSAQTSTLFEPEEIFSIGEPEVLQDITIPYTVEATIDAWNNKEKTETISISFEGNHRAWHNCSKYHRPGNIYAASDIKVFNAGTNTEKRFSLIREGELFDMKIFIDGEDAPCRMAANTSYIIGLKELKVVGVDIWT